METSSLKVLLANGRPEFWKELRALTQCARGFAELFVLSSWRKKARARKLPPPGPVVPPLKLALLGGCSLYPLHELLEHLCEIQGTPVDVWLGGYDNYVSEIMDEAGELYAFAPHVVFLLPAGHRCKYSGPLTGPRAAQQAEAAKQRTPCWPWPARSTRGPGPKSSSPI